MKLKLLDKMGVPLDSQRLLFSNKQLEDPQVLSKVGVGKESLVFLVLKIAATPSSLPKLPAPEQCKLPSKPEVPAKPLVEVKPDIVFEIKKETLWQKYFLILWTRTCRIFYWLHSITLVPFFNFVIKPLRDYVVKPFFVNLSNWIIKPFFRTLWNNVLVPFYRALKWITQNTWRTLLRPVLNGLRRGLTGVWNGTVVLKNGLSRVLSWLWREIVARCGRAISLTIRWIWSNALVPIGKGTKQLVVSSWNLTKQFLKGIWNWIIKPIFKGLDKLMQGSWNLTKKLFKGIGEIVKGLWKYIVKPFLDGINKLLRMSKDGLVTTTKAVWNWILKPTYETFVKVLKYLWNSGTQITGWIWRSLILQLLKGFKQLTIWIWRSLILQLLKGCKEGVKWTWNLLKGFIKGSWRHILQPMGDTLIRAIKDAWLLFKTVLQGTWNWIIKPFFRGVKKIGTTTNEWILVPFSRGVRLTCRQTWNWLIVPSANIIDLVLLEGSSTLAMFITNTTVLILYQISWVIFCAIIGNLLDYVVYPAGRVTKQIIQKAGNVLGRALRWTWRNAVLCYRTVFNWLVSVIKVVFNWNVTHIISPLYRAFYNTISWIWRIIILKILTFIWNSTKTSMRFVHRRILSPCYQFCTNTLLGPAQSIYTPFVMFFYRKLGWSGLSSGGITTDIIGGGIYTKTAPTTAELFIKRNSSFSIYIHNHNNTRYICSLRINSNEVGKYMIAPKSSFNIKRPVSEDKEFVFTHDSTVVVSVMPTLTLEQKRERLEQKERQRQAQRQQHARQERAQSGQARRKDVPQEVPLPPMEEPEEPQPAVFGGKSNQEIGSSVICYADEDNAIPFTFHLLARTRPWRG
uniref:Ubiquitin-like domain-containing protein n=1 Tax=Arcella intermedia TaxID=1963864 RepID=A0A6B2KXL9_9EUKA